MRGLGIFPAEPMKSQYLDLVYEHEITIPEGYVLSCVGAMSVDNMNNSVYQYTMFYRSDYLVPNYGDNSPTDGWYVWGEGNLSHSCCSSHQR